MKKKLLPSILALAVLTGNAIALTPVKDDFKSNKLSSKLWYQYKVKNGRLVPSGGKLNYQTKGKATKDDFVSLELLNSQPGYNENWQLIVDLSNTSGAGNKAAAGITFFNVKDRSDYLYLEYFGKSGLAGGLIQDGKPVDKGRITLSKATAKGSLRVSFDKDSKLFTLHISATDKSQGYKWVEVGTFSPSGKGGDVRANWKMTPGSGNFGIQLFGYGYSKTIVPGKITYDNFAVSKP